MSLSEIECRSITLGAVFKAEDVKRKIQSARKRLKEFIDEDFLGTNFYTDGFDKILKKEINKIFLEEFGEDLI